MPYLIMCALCGEWRLWQLWQSVVSVPTSQAGTARAGKEEEGSHTKKRALQTVTPPPAQCTRPTSRAPTPEKAQQLPAGAGRQEGGRDGRGGPICIPGDLAQPSWHRRLMGCGSGHELLREAEPRRTAVALVLHGSDLALVTPIHLLGQIINLRLCAPHVHAGFRAQDGPAGQGSGPRIRQHEPVSRRSIRAASHRLLQLQTLKHCIRPEPLYSKKPSRHSSRPGTHRLLQLAPRAHVQVLLTGHPELGLHQYLHACKQARHASRESRGMQAKCAGGPWRAGRSERWCARSHEGPGASGTAHMAAAAHLGSKLLVAQVRELVAGQEVVHPLVGVDLWV